MSECADCTVKIGELKRSGIGCVPVFAVMLLGTILLALSLLTGCATSDSAQPAKANTMNNTFDDCTFIIAANATISNGVYRAEGGSLPTLELFTQTQSLESSGTESFAQTSTQTPTTDIRPDIDVAYNDAIKNATDASRGVLESLLSASKDKVLELMASKQSGTVEVTKTDGATATVECKDGQCSICTDCTPSASK